MLQIDIEYKKITKEICNKTPITYNGYDLRRGVVTTETQDSYALRPSLY